MSKKYYLQNGAQKTGPFSIDELQQMEVTGLLDGDAMIIDGSKSQNAFEFLQQVNSGLASDDPDTVLRTAASLESKSSGPVTKARWESLLFIVSFPVLIPSLIIMYIMAKRWGHVDIYLILIDGLIFTGLAFLSGFTPGVIILISWFSSIFLYWLRRDRQEYGIFLGYSNIVATLLIFGGALTIGGMFATAPLKEFSRWKTIRKSTAEASLKRALNHELPLERSIRFTDANLGWDNAIKRQKFDGKWRFVTKQEETEILSSYKTGDIKKLWASHKEMNGREVQLTDVRLDAFANQRNRVEIMEGEGKKQIETPGWYFWLLAESDLRVWLVTKGPLQSGVVSARGTARVISHDAATGKALNAALKQNMPYMGIAIFEGEESEPPPPPPGPEAEEIWVPVTDSRGAFWVRFPEGKIPDHSESAEGIHTGLIDNFEGLVVLNTKLFTQSSGRVLYQQTPENYLSEQKIVEQMNSSIEWKHFPWLAAGLAMLLTAIWRARYE